MGKGTHVFCFDPGQMEKVQPTVSVALSVTIQSSGSLAQDDPTVKTYTFPCEDAVPTSASQSQEPIVPIIVPHVEARLKNGQQLCRAGKGLCCHLRGCAHVRKRTCVTSYVICTCLESLQILDHKKTEVFVDACNYIHSRTSCTRFAQPLSVTSVPCKHCI